MNQSPTLADGNQVGMARLRAAARLVLSWGITGLIALLLVRRFGVKPGWAIVLAIVLPILLWVGGALLVVFSLRGKS